MNIRMSKKLSEIDTEKENWDEEPIAAAYLDSGLFDNPSDLKEVAETARESMARHRVTGGVSTIIDELDEFEAGIIEKFSESFSFFKNDVSVSKNDEEKTEEKDLNILSETASAIPSGLAFKLSLEWSIDRLRLEIIRTEIGHKLTGISISNGNKPHNGNNNSGKHTDLIGIINGNEKCKGIPLFPNRGAILEGDHLSRIQKASGTEIKLKILLHALPDENETRASLVGLPSSGNDRNDPIKDAFDAWCENGYNVTRQADGTERLF